jgi:hypothetical protein
MNKHTAINILRETLKSGPLGEAYSHARRIKRRVFDKPVPVTGRHLPLPLEMLTPEVASLPDEPRLYFSLALRYLESDAPDALLKALACLRCAHTLEHPSPERITLYKALTATRRGLPDAGALLRDLRPYELTPEENLLCEEGLAGPLAASRENVPPQGVWQTLTARVAQTGAASLLVVGDEEAVSADWLPTARYLLVATSVTGLTPAAVARIGREWQLGVGLETERERLRDAGVSCAQWINSEVEIKD